MRIGLITDTHIPTIEKELPAGVKAAFQGVDLILHAGDIYTISVLDELEKIAPVLAALGDDDYPGPDDRIKPKHVLKLEGQTLWLTHIRYTLLPTPENNNKPDIFVFGHAHRTVVESSDGVLYVNSGSPTFLSYQRGPGTVGLLELNSGKAEARIIHL
ncbi:MAG: metallophosphoesterase family protein [Dehalococcoidales bacterium]|nr:metallophosphoesterase family protein [Dehalococcoidales bacterium]